MNELDLFVAALAISDPARRVAYLKAECKGNAPLQQRIEVLLAANVQSSNPLDNPLIGPPDGQTFSFVSDRKEPTEDYVDPTVGVGSVLAGKFKLVEKIGEGGMGNMYLARQTDPVKRVVAVKVIKAGMDSKSVLTRFEAERQAPAMMDHPNIAKVLDAGTTEGGRPFFIMELVKGVTITQYCDERKLTPRQRLELFVPVCHAIQHAHQKGVIHRDIKPSNVLVALYDDQAVPKVIDFGVAKAAGQALTDKTLMTGFGAVVGMPEYMSPEQANLNNLDIDTRCDVYSLGVLLYELLTGSTCPMTGWSLNSTAIDDPRTGPEDVIGHTQFSFHLGFFVRSWLYNVFGQGNDETAPRPFHYGQPLAINSMLPRIPASMARISRFELTHELTSAGPAVGRCKSVENIEGTATAGWGGIPL